MDRNKEIYNDWILSAEEDLLVTETLLKYSPSLVSAIAFNAEQAAEKMIKAYLIKLNIKLIKTHDFDKLLALIENREEFSASLYELVVVFDKFNVEVRYPDSESIPNKEELLEMIECAKKIYSFFKKLF